jgi:serine/threonine-protein kinase 11
MHASLSVPSLTPFPGVIAVTDDAPHVKCLNQYRRLSVIGRGSSSKVFAARDRVDGQLYAIKQLSLRRRSSSGNNQPCRENEIRLLRKIRHPNIVPFREVLHVRPSKTVYLVTSFADCGSAESVIRAGAMSPSVARYIFRNAALGLSYLHSLRIVHQDIKPANILLSRDGGVYLNDFGMSHSFDETLTVFGTPLYHAPEVLDVRARAPGEWPGKQDVWSLGITLYEMLCGRTPFTGSDIYEIIGSIGHTQLVRPEGADDDVWKLIGKMLAIDPARRFGMEEVMKSRYVAEAPEKVDFSALPVMEIPDGNPDAPVVEVMATV